jgi:hypothetical protein
MPRQRSLFGKGRRDLWSVNIDGTAHVVNAALAQHVPPLSSMSAPWLPLAGPAVKKVTEEKSLGDSKYNTNYAISKFSWRDGSLARYRGGVAGCHRQSQHHPGLWGLEPQQLRAVPQHL